MVFENGYSGTVMFAFTGSLRTVLIHIVNDSGTAIESIQFFEEDDVVAAPDGYDVNISENFFRANFPQLTIHAFDPDMNVGVDILVEALVQPTISELPNGVGIGRLTTPNMPVSIAWYFLPWNKITGSLTINGEEIPVSGHGWSDHQFGTDDFFPKACQYFYWANFPLGEDVLTLFEAQGGAAQGYRTIKWLWNFKGEKIYSYDRDADFYIYAEDIEEGDTLPKKLMYVFESDRIRGKVTCTWRTLLQQQPVDAPPNGKVVLNRSTYDCHAELTIDGREIDEKFVRILEVAYTLDQVPTIIDHLKVVATQNLDTAKEITAQNIEAMKNMNERNIGIFKKLARRRSDKASAQATATAPVPTPAPTIDTGGTGEPRFTLKSKLGDVLGDPDGQAVLEQYLPGISSDPNTKMGYKMSLKMLFGMPATGVSKETLEQIEADLYRIKN
jgi:hypothetical protein